ncbi:DUF2188 domain-containing protein [Nonomuraea zeae]|uniref:DUF2188 domain-containing protein n=1 Tax=Nonomuraea zeae TaxID=1642303 RepID=UPI0014781308|nr:DUF2188 domain-containing protein [Nonomuraea zeae]
MSYLRQLGDGRWQATVRLPGGKRRSATHDTRSEARRWSDFTHVAARRLAHAAPQARRTWSPDRLTIFVPVDLLTMDTAMRLEQALDRVLGEQQPPGGS